MSSSALVFSGLLLRPYADSDAGPFSEAVRESADTAGRWLPWCSGDYDIRRALEWFDACRSARDRGSAFEYGIFCANSGEVLGGAGLNDINHQHRFCNLGYWVRQSKQRQGIASRCVRALTRQAFGPLGLQRVEIVVAVGNLASEGVAIKTGARHEGVARNRLYLHGQPIAAHMFSLVAAA